MRRVLSIILMQKSRFVYKCYLSLSCPDPLISLARTNP